MPYTIYPRTYVTEQSMHNYHMATGPGRTYRYYPSARALSRPLYEFGFGLSLTTFHLTCRRHREEGKRRGERKLASSLWYAFEREKGETEGEDEKVQRSLHGTGKKGGIREEEISEEDDEAMENVNYFPLTFECLVENTGARDGDAVVMVYHSAGETIRAAADYPVPVRWETFYFLM